MIVQGIACRACNTAIWSKYRHDFHYCPCGNIAVDGGRDYLKVSFSDIDPVLVEIDIESGEVLELFHKTSEHTVKLKTSFELEKY